MNIAVLASHTGTTLQAVLDACREGRIAGRVAVVISNNSGSGALARARAAGVPAVHLSGQTHPEQEALDGAIMHALLDHAAEVVMLAGYMKKLGPKTLSAFRGRIFNTHPALLPAFGGRGMYGMHVHEAVLAAGARESGASFHVVDAQYDTGPVLAQARVAVEPTDTADSLGARVQARERELIVETLNRMAIGDLKIYGGSAVG
jgi:phosphoribosylglycinamide formyltransferase-1